MTDTGAYGEIFVGDQKVAGFKNWTRDQHWESSQPSQVGGSPVSVPGMHWTTLSVTQLTCFDNSESFYRALDDSRSTEQRFSVTLYDHLADQLVVQYAVAQFLVPPSQHSPKQIWDATIQVLQPFAA